jgi:glutamate/tyrosine decarboxylase-like PLP-dependent enzyme
MSTPTPSATHSTTEDVLNIAATRAQRYVQTIADRRVAPAARELASLAEFNESLPDRSTDPSEIIAMLDDVGSPATVATTGGRYFGFVIGGSLPASMAASWLANAWDQNAALRVMSPIAAELEEVVLRWMCDLFCLPANCGGGLVTCATMANFTALVAARHALLARAGWNVADNGTFGAPPIEVVVGEEVHMSIQKALNLAGFGNKRVTIVEADSQGRMRVDRFPKVGERTIVCIQAGNVNTGAFDPAEEICARSKEHGAWVHVDGAFGLWANASPKYRHLTRGFNQADSWATDAHKWPNVSYDSGVVIVRDDKALRAALTTSAAYLDAGARREAMNNVPEASRRARAVELWAGLKSLGRSGLCSLVERTCAFAQKFAERLREAKFEILNDVVINQVLVSFGNPEQTREVIRQVQEEGTCWCGGTIWQGKTAMRISVSSWATTEADIDRSLAAIIRIARGVVSNLKTTPTRSVIL